MTTTSVGMRCPECARDRTPVRTISSLQSEPKATYALIAINVLAYLGTSSGKVAGRGELWGPGIAHAHEYWRLVTSGFLHAGLFHLGFNMFALYFLGRILEPAVGTKRFVAIYLVALLGGSLGALILTPDAFTVGASGAIFGLLGAAIVVARDRGISIADSGLGGILLINLIFSFTISNISIGGHLGGLFAGGLAALVLVQLGERRRQDLLAYAGCVVIAAALVAGAVAAAQRSGIT